MTEKMGIVDVGGGLRGVYAAGVLDRCLQEHIRFDLGIGVSAGSANLTSFIAGQAKRNYKFYTEYSLRKEYMSFGNFIRKRSFINLDYVYGTLSNSDGEDPLDYQAFVKNPMELFVVAEEAETGHRKYFSKADMRQDSYDILKASSSIPFVCRPYFINGVPYFDGALADPVPIQKAFKLGCDKVVLILTLPEKTIRTSEKDEKLAARIRKKYPISADRIAHRAERYNTSVEIAKKYAQQGKVLIIAPEDTCGVGTLTRDANALRRFYDKGYEDGVRIRDFLKAQHNPA